MLSLKYIRENESPIYDDFESILVKIIMESKSQMNLDGTNSYFALHKL